MNKVISLFALITLLSLFACQNDSKSPMLVGEWHGAAWTLNGQDAGRDFASVKFEFKADGTYATQFGNQKESGTYRMEGMELYTTGENKIEKMVSFSKIAKDSLVMDMNRQGDSEQLVLVRK